MDAVFPEDPTSQFLEDVHLCIGLGLDAVEFGISDDLTISDRIAVMQERFEPVHAAPELAEPGDGA